MDNQFSFTLKEADLLDGLTPYTAHADELTVISDKEIVTHKPKDERKLGLLKGDVIVADDFTDEDEQINNMFYNDGE